MAPVGSSSVREAGLRDREQPGRRAGRSSLPRPSHRSPRSAFWAAALHQQVRGPAVGLELGLELTDAPPGRHELAPLSGGQARDLSTVELLLTPPDVDGLVADVESRARSPTRRPAAKIENASTELWRIPASSHVVPRLPPVVDGTMIPVRLHEAGAHHTGIPAALIEHRDVPCLARHPTREDALRIEKNEVLERRNCLQDSVQCPNATRQGKVCARRDLVSNSTDAAHRLW